MRADPSPEDIPPEYYEAVGRVSNAWATFEWELDALIALAAGIPSTACACMTGQMIGPNPRFRALGALVGMRKDAGALLKTINRMSENMRSIAAERNRLVHDPLFSVIDVPGFIVRAQKTADRKLVYKLFKVEIEALKALEKKIWNQTNALKIFYDQMRRELAPLPSRSLN